MDSKTLYVDLLAMADEEQARLEKLLPTDPISCFGLFTETVRVFDYWGGDKKFMTTEFSIPSHDIDIMRMGWNLMAHYSFKKIDQPGFPFRESTYESRMQVATLLYRFGCVSLVRRIAEMVKGGIFSVEQIDKGFSFKRNDFVDYQFHDAMEFSFLQELEEKIKKHPDDFYEKWRLVNEEELPNAFFKEGNFLLRSETRKFSEYLQEDIDTMMVPLIRPWDSGHGIMISYDSTPQIDWHFLALAAELVHDWQSEAGLHPQAKLFGIDAVYLIYIVVFIVSIHLKHVHFASLAAKHYSEILIPQSMTIWTPFDDLKQDIADFTGIEPVIVSKIFDLISMKAEDAILLKNYTTKFMPLLVDMENGFVLRPVSSLLTNPFFSIIAILEHRNPEIKDTISYPREEWLRTHLYALLSGARYQHTNGNVKLRKVNKTVTDIDAAIYDNLTGELALFQIKWQNYFSNDVKRLRSKASNLANELDRWAENVTAWIDDFGSDELVKALRIKVVKSKGVSGVYLFGLSRDMSRTQGYGFKIKSKNLAVTNWHQLVRRRTEIGPAERVFHSLFHTFKEEECKSISITPIPVEIKIADKTLRFEDLWVGVDQGS